MYVKMTSLNQIRIDRIKEALPSTPILSPYFGLIIRIWGELITVKSVASVDLQAAVIYQRKKNWRKRVKNAVQGE